MRTDRVSAPADLYPVESFFDRLGAKDFMKALEEFSQGWGYSVEGTECSFPKNISEHNHIPPAEIDHIEFWTLSGYEEVRVSFAQFMGFLREAAEVEAQLRPERAERIAELVEATARALGAPQPAAEVTATARP